MNGVFSGLYAVLKQAFINKQDKAQESKKFAEEKIYHAQKAIEKKRKKTIRIVIFSGIMISLIAAGAIGVLYLHAPDISAQLPSNTLVVTISSPQSGIVLLLGGPYTVRAEVVGPVDITNVELWDNNDLVGSAQVRATGGYSYQAVWDWTPGLPGIHVLTARAQDSQNQIAISDPILLTISQSDTSVTMDSYTVQEGDTLESIAADLGIILEDLRTYNSVPDPELGLTVGEKILFPISNTQQVATSQTERQFPPNPILPAQFQSIPTTNLSPFSLMVQEQFSSAENPPVSPILTGEAIGCNANLYISDQSNDELGFLVYRYYTTGKQWALIDTIQNTSGNETLQYQVEASLSRQGTLFMVEAFNKQGKSASNPVLISPPQTDDCGQTHWQGVQISDGVLILPPIYEKVYVYMSVDGGQYRRIPSQEGYYLPAVQNGFDMESFVPPITLEEAQVLYEAWGWQGGSLTKIGSGESAGIAGQGLPNPNFDTELKISTLEDFSEVSPGKNEAFIRLEPWEFMWLGKNTGSLQGRVQISLNQFPPTADLNPQGLMAEKDIASTIFEIDFGEVLGIGPNVKTMIKPTLAPGSLQANSGLDSQEINPGVIGLFPGATMDSQNSLQLGLQPGNLQVSPITKGILTANPIDFYIRVLPMQNGKLVGKPSNTVIARYIPPDPNLNIKVDIINPPLVEPIYQTKILKYVPPDFEDPNRWGCVVVTGHDEEVLKKNMNGELYKSLYPIGSEKCPDAYTGGNTPTIGSVLGDVFSGFKYLFNFVTGLYNDFKAFAIELVLDILPCGGLEDICKSVISAAVDYGLTAVGLPPSLPDFDQFAAAAKGELVDMITEEVLANSPVPCIDICKEQLQNAIEMTVDSAMDAMENTSVAPSCVSKDEAHQHGREPWCPPPGIIVKPALRATDQPASAVVEVSLLPGAVAPEDYPECWVTVGISVSKFFKAQDMYGYGLAGGLVYPIEAQTVTMAPYYGENFKVKPLGPGEKDTYVVVFDKTSMGYYLPWTEDMYKNSQVVPSWKQDWYMAVRHSNATLYTISNLPLSGQSFHPESACVTVDQVQFEMP